MDSRIVEMLKQALSKQKIKSNLLLLTHSKFLQKKEKVFSKICEEKDFEEKAELLSQLTTDLLRFSHSVIITLHDVENNCINIIKELLDNF